MGEKKKKHLGPHHKYETFIYVQTHEKRLKLQTLGQNQCGKIQIHVMLIYTENKQVAG